MKPTRRAREVEDFAAYLSRVKERGGQSYGSLARRLNVSASTLHRYCSGEAVPADFALLERLAQMCKATPEERLELHRTWLAATQARRMPERGPADPEPADPEPAPRRPRGRRSRYVAVAMAAGVIAVVVMLAALMSPDPAGDPNPDPNPDVESSEDRDLAGDPDPDPDASEDQAPAENPSPDVDAPEDRDLDAGQGQEDAPAPLDWTVDSHVWQSGCSHRYLIDRPAGEVPAPPAQQDAKAWAESLGAVHGGQTLVRVTVQGRDSAAVVLEALRVRVAERAAPAQGNVFSMDIGCGGAVVPRAFEVDLDADRPLALSRPGSDENGEIPAVTFPYAVSVSEPEVLLVTADTMACACDWYLELEWSSQGRSSTVRIDDGGRPFRTSSVDGLPQYDYWGSDDNWTPSE
ncbi:helix-turn-helix domain-containing protein [Streptomyces phytophilus]|uniref:helix-turn-helix domain-containing protein n=1 Tax=Streptomyces phytophilus TaxID=722715 RepID=UPI0015F0C6D1|nr:helix-turn-helix domain-containing protein [Streptomyces phytophilus]